jgi:HAE1 family hydrophobic/amphiphilic exporter-1
VRVDQAAIDVRQRVDTIQGRLPEGAAASNILKFDPADEPILRIALSAPGADLLELRRVAEERLEAPLQQVLGVADVRIVGAPEREVQVLLDPGQLVRYNLTAPQVIQAIAAATAVVPAGSLTLGGERILLSLRSTLSEPRELEALLVDPVRGLTVADVGVVRDTVAETQSFVRVNGNPVLLLEVRKESGANAVSTAQGVRRALAQVTLPDGYQAVITGDNTAFVRSSVFDTLRETLLATAAVALVVLFFLGRLGSTFSVVLAIPITVAGAVMLFGLLGFSFNVVTLLAVTVAVGLVVDDSIVIAENVERYRKLGYPQQEAVFKGAGEVIVAVLTATLSLLAVFIPIGFLPGVIGQFFSQFGLSLAAMIAVSYLEAMFFLTVRLAYLPDPGLRPASPVALAARWGASAFKGLGSWRAWAVIVPVMAVSATGVWWLWGPPWVFLVALVPLLWLLLPPLVGGLMASIGSVLYALHYLVDAAGIARLREAYARALDWSLGRSGVILVTAGLLVASLALIVPRLSFNFVSGIDTGQLVVTLELPAGSSLMNTDALASRVEAELLRQPYVQLVRTRIGAGDLLGNPSPERASLRVELIPRRQREAANLLAEQLQARLTALLADRPEVEITVTADDNGVVPVDTGIELVLTATDQALLMQRDELAREVMRQNPYLRNVGSSFEGTVSERVFVVDSARLVGTGLTVRDVAQTLRTYNVGTRAAELRQGGEEVPIVVRVDPARIGDEQALLSLPIYAPQLQRYLPLAELGRFQLQAVPLRINRVNQAFSSTLTAELAPGAPGQLQVRNAVIEAFAAQGVTDQQVRVGTGVGPDLLGDLAFYGPIAFALALVLNYLVIASQFNSFKYPLYLLLTVPLALVGAFWLFFFTGTPLDVISVLGVVILIGLVTKNAILLLDLVVSRVEAHASLREALIAAGKLRLRPILMTALTVVTISVPLLLGLGDGSEFRRPLGLVILGGVVSSTFLTLFVVPAAFYRFERRRFEAPVESEPAGLQPHLAGPEHLGADEPARPQVPTLR